MGFAVCHIQKGAGNDAPVTAHIGRRVHPANADQSREHLRACLKIQLYNRLTISLIIAR